MTELKLFALVSVLLIAGPGWVGVGSIEAPGSMDPQCDPDNGGLTLPDGFCALVVAEDVGLVRHIAIAPNGDIFAALRSGRRGNNQGGVLALRDTDGDGRADTTARFDDRGGTGIALHGGYVYFGHDGGVVRYPVPEGSLIPSGPAEVVVADLPNYRSHNAKSLVISGDDLYVNIGAPSNSCQVEDRGVESPGQDPCPELETRAGIWIFDANRTGQSQSDGERFATGLRNVVALTVHPRTGTLYGAQHGRDQLSQNWPDLYTVEEGAEQPAEEFVRITRGDDFGWPYCYYDPQKDQKVLAPEYGGDGDEVGRCASKKDPLIDFPGHWAPNGIAFYFADHFPDRYRGGAFIAFHGSWNRAPLPQEGYKVVFVPFEGGEPKGDYETFADGFAGGQMDPRDAEHRPVGVTVGPDGSLYISADRGSSIWRVFHRG